MSLLDIVHYPDPVLLTVGKPVGEDEFDAGLALLVANMFETMGNATGVGLAAPQVGVSKRLFVMGGIVAPVGDVALPGGVVPYAQSPRAECASGLAKR